MEHAHHHHETAPLHSDPPLQETVRDPVCGMSVSPATTSSKHEHAGTTYYFCNPRCAERFRAEPGKYLAREEPTERTKSTSCCGCGGNDAAAAAPNEPSLATMAARTYACPMHRDVVQQGPGSCPKCGMALDPV